MQMVDWGARLMCDMNKRLKAATDAQDRRLNPVQLKLATLPEIEPEGVHIRGKHVGDAGLEKVVLVAYEEGAEKDPADQLMENEGRIIEEKSRVRRLWDIPSHQTNNGFSKYSLVRSWPTCSPPFSPYRGHHGR